MGSLLHLSQIALLLLLELHLLKSLLELLDQAQFGLSISAESIQSFVDYDVSVLQVLVSLIFLDSLLNVFSQELAQLTLILPVGFLLLSLLLLLEDLLPLLHVPLHLLLLLSKLFDHELGLFNLLLAGAEHAVELLPLGIDLLVQSELELIVLGSNFNNLALSFVIDGRRLGGASALDLLDLQYLSLGLADEVMHRSKPVQQSQ